MNKPHRVLLSLALTASLAASIATSPAQAQNLLPPIAIASLEVTTPATDTTPAAVTLDGSDSFDPDGSIVRYRWEVITEAYSWLELNQAGPQSPTATFEVPVQELIERFGWSIEFRLTVTDSGRPAATDSDGVRLRINQPPVASIDVTAKLFDRDDEVGYDDNRNGVVDENEERYTIEGLVSGPGERGNAQNEWHARASSLLVIDASGSFDPDGELTNQSFSWERLRTIGAASVARSLPGDTVGQRFLSTDEDLHSPASSRTETVARLPFVRGVGTEPFTVFYRLTVTDEDGAIAREIVKIVFDDFHDHPEVEIARPESDPHATSADDRYEGVLEAGEDRYVISSDAAEEGVALFADGEGDGSGRTNALVHSWSGAGVVASEDNEPGSRSEAEFTAPEGTIEGDSFTVTVEVVDPDGLATTASIELVVADTAAPTATAPDDIDTPDGIGGGYPPSDPPTGVVQLRGIAFDSDGDELTYYWEQVRNARGDPLTERWRGLRLLLSGSTTPNASFKPPEVLRGTSSTVYVQFTVADKWGVTATDIVRITIRDSDSGLRYYSGVIDGHDYCTNLSLGGPLTHPFDSDEDGVADTCALQETRRATVARQIALEQLATLNQDAYSDALFGAPDNPRTPDVDESTAGACATAPVDLGDTDVELVQDACGRFAADPSDDVALLPRPEPVDAAMARVFYSGVIDSPTFCANHSLGGPTAYPFDHDGDGVADVCALPYTRREAVARHNALLAAFAHHPQFPAALAAACTSLGSLEFDDPFAALAVDACSIPPADPELGNPLPSS